MGFKQKCCCPLSPFHSALWDPFFPAPWVNASGSITHLPLLENKTSTATLSGKKHNHILQLGQGQTFVEKSRFMTL